MEWNGTTQRHVLYWNVLLGTYLAVFADGLDLPLVTAAEVLAHPLRPALRESAAAAAADDTDDDEAGGGDCSLDELGRLRVMTM